MPERSGWCQIIGTDVCQTAISERTLNMFKRRFRGLAALTPLAALVIAGCAGLQVQTDYNPQASFSQLRTYDWITEDTEYGLEPAVNSPLVEVLLL